MRFQTRAFKWVETVLLSAFLSMFSVSALAWSELIEDPLSNGYGACSWRDNGNGTSTLRVTINFKEAAGHIGKAHTFYSRGIMLYTYKTGGVMNLEPSTPAPAQSVRLNGVPAKGVWLGGRGYKMYHGGGAAAEAAHR